MRNSTAYRILPYLMVLVMLAALVACGSDSTAPGQGISIEGKLYNESAVGKPAPTRTAAAVINSTYSTLKVTDPIRLPALNASDWIVMNGTIYGPPEVLMEGVAYATWLEDPSMLTPESWRCMLRYNTYDGKGMIGKPVWEIIGGTLGNEQPTPTYPACEGEPPQDASFVCDSEFYDCANPFWTIDYQQPGDGLAYGNGFAQSLVPKESITFQGGRRGGFLPRSGVLSRFEVYDTKGAIADRKDYIFDLY